MKYPKAYSQINLAPTGEEVKCFFQYDFGNCSFNFSRIVVDTTTLNTLTFERIQVIIFNRVYPQMHRGQ